MNNVEAIRDTLDSITIDDLGKMLAFFSDVRYKYAQKRQIITLIMNHEESQIIAYFVRKNIGLWRRKKEEPALEYCPMLEAIEMLKRMKEIKDNEHTGHTATHFINTIMNCVLELLRQSSPIMDLLHRSDHSSS